jgi:ATP-dependent Lhr-like helicase
VSSVAPASLPCKAEPFCYNGGEHLFESMPSLPFHPVVRDWFARRFGAPTPPQLQGWPEIAAGRHTLIAAPTGSGKTLAAFLSAIDGLLRDALDGRLEDRTQVLYVSPLKALSNDIRRNLDAPLAEIVDAARASGRLVPPLRALVRTGDTPQHERAMMLKRPPHILVTTPESLYLLLTSEKSRAILGGVRTVIVDEIHALARDKRGSHLALSLERLEALCERLPVRVGLSATQKPVEEIARFLVGARRVDAAGRPDCAIIDSGHARALDLDVELPASPLQAVCSNEQWAEVDARLVELIGSHRSTLIFVNTRRMAERVAHRLTEKLGEDAVASHHGSLSKDLRLDAEERLKSGKLKAIVATASLELGIDVGFIDLVCQLGSPRSIATFLQRVGRAGHRLGVVPKGRLFALTRDELLESLALLRAVRQGRLDAVEMPEAPLDILAQQVVAEVSARDCGEDELFALSKGAWPFRNLSREMFDSVITLLSEGIARGRKDMALLHRDAVNKLLKPRRAARLTAITSGGAIPETADYRVVTEEEGTFVGTINEDFAIESMAGDVFLLGNTSWRVRYVRAGQVVVCDAHGAPATVPFWLGEAPARTIELSRELSEVRAGIANAVGLSHAAAVEWITRECGVNSAVADQAYAFCAAQLAAVGFLPTQEKILFERFFDESGGMQLVIHSPYGARVNRAWGLALRKSFCRTFDFELQASADDNGIVLSIGPQQSFPLQQMFTLLKSEKAEETLVQALLAAPMFQVRWRWNVTRALAVLRSRGGKKVPPPLQRFRSDDLLTAVFPLQTACFEHRPPNLEVPDHPLVRQTVHDCMTEAMDLARWTALLRSIETKKVELVAADTREPSPFSHAILNANPYAFLDDAPLEERRARAVALRRTLDPGEARDLAKLDPAAIAQVREEAQPFVRDEEELHDSLLSLVACPAQEEWRPFFERLREAGRAGALRLPDSREFWSVSERWMLARSAYPDAEVLSQPSLPGKLADAAESIEAVSRLVRGRIEVCGPTTAALLSEELGIRPSAVEAALFALEAEGVVLQGEFSAPGQWCERRLLSRIHRLTLDGARKRVQAVPPQEFWRFLSEYHRLAPGKRREGRAGLFETVGQLQGFELAASAWETDILPSRSEKYQPDWLDTLSFSGELAWGRLRPPRKAEEDAPERPGAALTRVAPIALSFRADLGWMLPAERPDAETVAASARPDARKVYAALKQQGALFFDDLGEVSGLLPAQVKEALSELAALGLVTSDGFSALRGLVLAKPAPARRSRWGAPRAAGYGRSGRWTLFPGRVPAVKPEDRPRDWAWQLLRRYGVLFRDLLTRESAAPSWWELVPVLRRLEARGEVRGGRFVSGVAGEQYALPEAVEALRAARESGRWLVVSAADPLNLAGVLDESPRVPALRGNRLLYRDGAVAAVLQAGEVSFRVDLPEAAKSKATRALQLQIPSLRDSLLAELAALAVSSKA